MKTTEFLYAPAAITETLADYPHIKTELAAQNPKAQKSTAFPNARKSARQIYRVMGNAHFPHLKALLETLDFCLRHGFRQPTILRTSARSAFVPALSELHVARHFLLRGFTVEGFDTAKRAQSVPEFIARKNDLALAVEVYAPVEWAGLKELVADFNDALKNLDTPFDYTFAVRIEQIEHFEARRRLLLVHLVELARKLDDARTRCAIVAPLIGEIEDRLCAGEPHFRVSSSQAALNVRLSIEITDVAKSESQLPERDGTISGPSVSGYAPEAVFDRLVDRRVRKKDAKAQAQRSGMAVLSLLAVDLSNAELREELGHDWYRRQFQRTMDRMRNHTFRYDLVAFCEAHRWGEELQLHFAIENREPGKSIRAAVFDPPSVAR